MDKYYYIKKRTKKRIKLLGIFFISIGVVSLFLFLFPLFSIYFQGVFAGSIEMPIPSYLLVKDNLSSNEYYYNNNYENAGNWYPNIQSSADKNNRIKSYKLSIPKLKIENATVSTTDLDLSKHLVQYSGESFPGEKGTVVIFGHSTFPYFFDPKNYKTIFATLHTLKDGDAILINVNGIIYNYRIVSIIVTEKDDTSIFSHSNNNAYITLVTCFPPGTVWKRLIVRAQIGK